MNNITSIEEIYKKVTDNDIATLKELNKSTKDLLDIIATHRNNNRGVLAVLITLLFKKIVSPDQDIRLHQHKMPGGFSARGLDERMITPFLKNQNFPYMKGGAGALTRSLEQSTPYSLKYTGAIRPVIVRNAFLKLLDQVQNEGVDAESALYYLLAKLVEYRSAESSLLLVQPQNLSIRNMVSKIDKHFQASRGSSSAAYLPTLAIYAVYQQLLTEVKRYKSCTLCDIQSHTSADSQTGLLGDIQVNDQEGHPFEVVEVKYNIELNHDLVENCYQKLKTTRVDTFYLLSTNEKINNIDEISKKILEVQKNHGCQIIVNGIQATLRYYLRLLSNPNIFFSNYIRLIEKNCDYETKLLWNELLD